MSGQTLSFSDSVPYGCFEHAARGIVVQTRLSADITVAWDVDARVDSGSSFCVFGRQWADLLGLDWESGEPVKISTASGIFYAHLHEVTIQLRDFNGPPGSRSPSGTRCRRPRRGTFLV